MLTDPDEVAAVTDWNVVPILMSLGLVPVQSIAFRVPMAPPNDIVSGRWTVARPMLRSTFRVTVTCVLVAVVPTGPKATVDGTMAERLKLAPATPRTLRPTLAPIAAFPLASWSGPGSERQPSPRGQRCAPA